MDLSNLTDEGAELVEKIGGMAFRFSELPVASLARLQSWIRENVPHPVESLKPHLEGLPTDERQYLLERARVDARDWPPQIGTPAGAMALLGSETGQVVAFWEGLRVHHHDASQDDAARIYRVLKKEVARESRRARKSGDAESPRVRRIYATLFGTAEMMDDDGESVPKGPASAADASNGKSSPVAANAS